jgi:hypothetical protein
MDGISNNNEWLGGQPLIYPSLDAVQELQVQTLNFSAEYGRNSGAIVNVITKSGSNDLHGSVFYTGRNTALNARNFFDSEQKTPLQQHQFGFSLGGPLRNNRSNCSDVPGQRFTNRTQFRRSIFDQSGSPVWTQRSTLRAMGEHPGIRRRGPPGIVGRGQPRLWRSV